MSLRHALLGLLAEAPMSGYDLTKRFEHSLGRIWPARHNQIYTELNKLLDEGLITLADYGPRGRKIYTIAAAGLTACRAWLTAETDGIDRSMRFEPLLRLNFVWLLEPPEAETVLSREEAYYREQAAWLGEQFALLPADETDAVVAARRCVGETGQRFYSDLAEACARLRSALTPSAGSPSR